MNVPGKMLSFERAFALHRDGRNAEALAAYDAVLAREPRHADALHYSALVLHATGRSLEAVGRIERSIAIDARTADVWSNAALVYMAVRRADDARRALEEALRREPGLAEAWLNLASLRLESGDPVGAEAAARRALGARESPQAWFNLALALVAQERHADALDALGRLEAQGAVADDDAAVPGVRAQTLIALGRRDEARAVLDRALARFDHAALRVERARLADARRDTAAAVFDYAAALALAPDDETALSELLFLKKRAADWDGLVALQHRFRARVRGYGLRPDAASALTPFSFLSDPSTRDEQRIAGEAWARRFPTRTVTRALSGGRLRIGYLSSDFHAHATAVLAAGLFERHDRSAFEVVAYSTGRDDGSAMRARLIRAFDRFVDARDWPLERTANAIVDDGIDILVDLKGYTDEATTAVVAARPAPIQVAYLGYPGTMGAPFVDYLLGDAVVTPFDHAADYCETLVQLPASYQINDDRREDAAADDGGTRGALGLPDDGVVYCCFNNVYKIGPDVFDAWMFILRAAPGSVLWLLTHADDVATRARLREAAMARGVAAERIVFADHRSHAAYLALYRHADCVLDTWPYNAHTTASDALWMGCPIVTMRGETFAGRVAASLLDAAGQGEWIAADRAGYVAMAGGIAARVDRLRASRDGTMRAVRASPLFDTAATTRAIEDAYRTMAAQYRERRREPFRVAPRAARQ